MTKILVVEDERNIRKLFVRLLETYRFQTITANNGVQALELLAETPVDLLVLDVMMPELNGFQVVEEVRRFDADLPIILVTAKESVADKKRGFLAGADDYMVKPVDEEEFILRIQALLRRAKIMTEKTITLNQTSLNSEDLSVTSKAGRVELPKKEFFLLFKLLTNLNKIFTRQQLMEAVWERESNTDERTVDTHIKRLRKRFDENQDFTIVTIRGLGYKAVKHED